MRVVIDTNALVSAATQPAGNPAKTVDFVLAEVAARRAEWLVSQEILREYREKLLLPRIRNKYPLFARHAERLLTMLASATVRVTGDMSVTDHAPDPDDAPFVAAAEAGKADYLVTGNRKHFPERIGRTRVVSPAEFVRHVVAPRR